MSEQKQYLALLGWYGFAKEAVELYPNDTKEQLSFFQETHEFFVKQLNMVAEEDLEPFAMPIADYMKASFISVWSSPLSDADRLWVLRQNIDVFLKEMVDKIYP